MIKKSKGSRNRRKITCSIQSNKKKGKNGIAVVSIEREAVKDVSVDRDAEKCGGCFNLKQIMKSFKDNLDAEALIKMHNIKNNRECH